MRKISMYDNGEEENPVRKIILYGVYILIGIFALIIIFGSFYTVGAGQRAILSTWGNPSMQPLSEGLHFKVPIAQTVVKMDIKTQKYEADAGAASKDLQIVHTKIAVNFHLDGSSVPVLFKEIGINYADKIIQPAIQEVVKQATAKYTAEELITHRELVKNEIDLLLRERLNGRGIVMETTSITNFDFSEEFNKAIEQKVTAEQNALKEQNNLRVVEYQAQQKVAQAKGDAEAIQIIDEQLRKSPTYIQYMATQKWDGVLPLATNGALPFINIGASQ